MGLRGGMLWGMRDGNTEIVLTLEEEMNMTQTTSFRLTFD